MKKFIIYITTFLFVITQSSVIYADSKPADNTEVSSILEKENLSEQDNKTLYKYGLEHGTEKKTSYANRKWKY